MGLSFTHCLDRRTVAEIQKEVTEKSQGGKLSKIVHSTSDKERISGWKQQLARIKQDFEVRLKRFICLLLTLSFVD